MRKNRGARLGQHFLNAPWAARSLIESLKAQPDETVLEIGPGKGALTKELLTARNRVVAIEKDEALAEILRSTFSEHVAGGRLTLIEGDVRNFNPAEHIIGPYVLAANIPYYITGEIIRQFLEAPRQPRAMALLIQKEVAERIVARDGKESILSLSVKAFGTPRLVAKVPKGCFNPPPSVDSAILLVDAISRDFFADVDEPHFFRIVKAGFASKRKKLLNNLGSFGAEKAQAAFVASGLSENVRAEDLVLAQWRNLAQSL